MEALGFNVKQEAVLRTLTDDVLKSSEIEGETLDAGQVRSSLARRLGIDIGGLKPRRPQRRRRGRNDAGRHAALRPAADRRTAVFAGMRHSSRPARSGMHPINVGAWRDDRTAPMQVVSGPVGRERVHFEAPAAARLEDEMRRFLDWFNGDATTEPVLKAAQAHLWFVTIHPFDDGNGRIARAIADMALARSEDSPQRFYSMSAQIRQERGDYYRILEQTQQGTMDITLWMEWFLDCLTRAIEGAHGALAGVITKARFWEKLRDAPLNDRQRLVINRLLDGFEGNADDVEVGGADEELAGYGARGHPAARRARRVDPECGGRAEYRAMGWWGCEGGCPSVSQRRSRSQPEHRSLRVTVISEIRRSSGALALSVDAPELVPRATDPIWLGRSARSRRPAASAPRTRAQYRHPPRRPLMMALRR